MQSNKFFSDTVSKQNKMKKIFIAIIGCLLMINTMAQIKIDRTKQPKPGPAPVISFADPVMYDMPNGITVLVVENHKLPKVTASYYIDYGPVTEGNKAGNLTMMGQMLNEGTTTMSKAQFDEAVDQIGAEVSLDATGGNASALARYFDKAFILMAEALRKPAFPQESFDKVKSLTLTDLKVTEKSAKAISERVVNALAYGLDHPNGEFANEQTVNNITLDDIKKAYAQFITPSRGYLTFVGDIKAKEAKALAEKAFADWKGVLLTLPKINDVKNPEKTEVDFVDVPNAVQSELTVTNLVSLPMSSPDYFAVLLANQILGGGADSRLFMNLREKHGFTYGSYSDISAGRWQTTFDASASVRNEKADSAAAEILKEINRIRTEKVSDEELKDAKAMYNGNFALGLENPARTASFARNILMNDLPKDFYRTYLQKINAVTVDDIQRVAQKYFNHDNTRIVVVGKADAVKTGMAKLGYDVKMYDKLAKPSTAKMAAAVNKSADEIIAKYIAAVGGEEEIKKVNSILITGEMSMQGNKLNVTQKIMTPNLQLMDLTMGGQPVMHQVFNGTTGYQAQMGNKQDLSEDELTEYKETKGFVQQLFYKTDGYKLEVAGVEKVGENDAYKIKVTSPSGRTSTEYYDATSGYLVKEDKTMKINGQEIQQSAEHSNYKKAGNIMIPFTNEISVQSPMGSQGFTIEIKDVKLNEGVTAEDFK
jgi:zinc protease